MYYSQFEQDKYLNEEIFYQKKNGVFVDIGAYDGITISNTYFFEKELNWTGICIEPHSEIFKELCKNRKSINVNACIYREEKEMTYWEILDRSDTRIISLLSGLECCYTPIYFQTFFPDLDDLISRNLIKKINVKTQILNNILKEHGVNKIDLLCIDTEGSELEILKSIDFFKFEVDVIVVENNFRKSEWCREYLEYNGYIFKHKLDVDEIYRKIKKL